MRMFAAVLTFLLASSVTAVAEPAWSPDPIAWGPCADFPDGECGTLRVPLDWRRPWGQTIDLAVARHRATDPAHRVGVLMANPGGPGSSNAELALTPSFFSPEIQARFDLVGLDARGTGGSEFFECPSSGQEQPSNEPVDQAEFDVFQAYARKQVTDCRAEHQPIFDHADTAVDTRDMEALRRALGEEKISFLGISYGTLMGQQYAEMFGDHVRAMVLDSTIDHSVDLRHFSVDRAAAADDAFLEFVHWCDRTAACVLHGQDVLATWQRALDAADQQPLPRHWLRDWVFGDLYAPDYADIARVIADTAAGTPPVTAQFIYNYTSIRLAVVCQDFNLRIRDYRQYSVLRAEELRRAPLMLGGDLGHDEATACMGVSGPPANPPHRLHIPHAPTILLLNSRHDPATPYAWAVNIHRQAPRNTVLLTYEGAGHAVYSHSPCGRAAADEYLLALTVPPPGASCPAV